MSLRVSKFRFLRAIFGGAVLCIYYANEFSFLPLFYSFSILLLLCSFTADSCYLPQYVSCLLSAGAVSLLTRYLTCHVTTLPRYHVTTLPRYQVATLFALCVPSGGVVLSCFAVEDFCSCWGVHRRHRQRAVNTFKLTC